MTAYSCRITLKGSKPPYWWRVNIPSGISFSALSILLDQMIGKELDGDFSFEVHQLARIWEPTAERPLLESFQYSAYDAAHTAVDLLFSIGKPVNYLRDGEIYQIRVEEVDEHYPFDYPLVMKSPHGTDTYAYIKKLQESIIIQDRVLKRPRGKARMVEQAKNGIYRIPQVERELKEDSPYYKRSSNLILQDLMDEIRDLIPDFDSFKGKIETRVNTREEFTFREILNFYNRKELIDLAQVHGISFTNKQSKEEIVERIAETLLDPDTIKAHFMCLTDEETAAFEEVRAAGGILKISEKREHLFDDLYETGYLFYSSEKEMIASTDVMEAYKEFSTHEFHALRKKVNYLRQCLNTIVPRYYSYLPMRKFTRVARREREPQIQASEIPELVKMIPDSMHDCVIKDDVIYAEQLIRKPEIAEMVRGYQKDKPYYIMREDEIDEILRYDYPQSNKYYRQFREYLISEMKVDPAKAESALRNTHQLIALTYPVQKFFDSLAEDDIIPSRGQVDEIMKHYMALVSNTRTMYNRGYTPLEIKRISGDDFMPRNIRIDDAKISVWEDEKK